MHSSDAASLLCTLLTATDRPYRGRWEAIGQARPGRQLCLRAVGVVLARHLVDIGVVDELDEPAWPRRHRDWLRRRLAGQGLGVPDLIWFADAFSMERRDRADLLGAAHRGRGSTPVEPAAWGDRMSPGDALTVCGVAEDLVLGRDGVPRAHRTVLTVAARRHGVRRVELAVGPVSRVDVVSRGGRGAALRSDAGLAIQFATPLDRGESATIAYGTRAARRRVTELRRAMPRDTATTLALRVAFDPSATPREVVGCQWPEASGPPAVEWQVVPTDGRAALRFAAVTTGEVGLRWSW